MSKGKNHHYVPRFLLRGFSSDQRSIGVVHKASRKIINQASISSQCSRDNFYQISLDDALSELEKRVAPIIMSAAAGEGLPPCRTPEHIDIVLFVVLQHTRTHQARDDYIKMSGDLASVVGVDDLPSEKELHAEALRISAVMAPSAFDLRVVMLVNKTDTPFIISDDPVIFHNTLFQSDTHRGHAGLRCAGFQAFLPTSRSTCLYLYDPSTYTINAKGSKYANVKKSDVFNLNRLQFINCKKNIYFDCTVGFSAVEELVHLEWDVQARSEIVEAVNDGNKNESIIHIFSPPICSDFKLFCSRPIPSVVRTTKSGNIERLRSGHLTKFYEFFAGLLEEGAAGYHDFYRHLDWFLANEGRAARQEYIAQQARMRRSPSTRFSVKSPR